MTSPTTGLAQPTFSSLVIIRGSAASDEEVPSTIRISSLMYRRNCQRLNPVRRAIEAQDDEDEEETGEVDARPSACPARQSVPTPYLPIVNAIAPKAPIGASRMMIPITPKSTCESRSSRSTSGLPFSPNRPSARPNRIENEQHLEDLAAGERADRRVGDDVQQEFDRRERLAARRCSSAISFGVERLDVGVDPGAGPHDVDDDQADRQRQRRDHLEIDERLEPDPADLLHVADLRDPDHDRGEDDRRDHHLDQLDEAIPSGFIAVAVAGKKMPMVTPIAIATST